MEASIYNPAWEQAKPVMSAALASIAAAILSHGLAIGEIEETGDEEFSLVASVNLDDVAIGYVDFTLHDGDVHGEAGFSVSLKWEGARGELGAHRWAPYNYTEKAFVDDVAEILRRIEQDLGAAAVANQVATDLLYLATPDYLAGLKQD